MACVTVGGYVLADNKLALNAGWDNEILAIELQGLIDIDFDVGLTGFSLAEIDIVLDDASDANVETPAGPEDTVPAVPSRPVSRTGEPHQAAQGSVEERPHFVPLGQCQPDAAVPPYRRLLADVDRPPGAAGKRSTEDCRVRYHPPAADQGRRAHCRNRDPCPHRAGQRVPRCRPVPPCRRQLARRKPVADAAVPPIKPIPATMPAPEIAPFPAPPETATRVSRKGSNQAGRDRARRLMNKTG